MKHLKTLGIALMLMSLFAAGLIATSCCSNKHETVSAEQFMYLLGERPVSTTAHAEFIGVAGDRAFLREWRGGGWWNDAGDHVFSVPLSELPPQVAADLRRGVNPWKSRAPQKTRSKTRIEWKKSPD